MSATATITKSTYRENLDPITETPLYALDGHPILSGRAMRRIDRAIHVWCCIRELSSDLVAIYLPRPTWRKRRKNETFDQAYDRPATPKEACAIRFEASRSFSVDGRRPDWREMAAKQLEEIAEELLATAAAVRERDGSELTECVSA